MRKRLILTLALGAVVALVVGGIASRRQADGGQGRQPETDLQRRLHADQAAEDAS